MPEVDAFIGTSQSHDILAFAIRRQIPFQLPVVFPRNQSATYLYDESQNSSACSLRPSLAFIKIAEGCDRCVRVPLLYSADDRHFRTGLFGSPSSPKRITCPRKL